MCALYVIILGVNPLGTGESRNNIHKIVVCASYFSTTTADARIHKKIWQEGFISTTWTVMLSTSSDLQSHTDVLPVA